MKDPWRIVDPITPVAEPAKQGRINLEDRDIDFDIRPYQSCVFRFKSCSIEVSARDLTTPRDALEVLAKCILELKKARPQFASTIHAKWVGDMSDVPNDKGTAFSRFECENVILWFAGMGLEHGALHLTRCLIGAGRDQKLAPIMKRHGVTPMLRT